MVDADLARLSGEDADRRLAAANELLNAIWEQQHVHIAFDAQLQEEWNKHARAPATQLYRRLAARRLRYLEPPADLKESCHAFLKQHENNKGALAAREKDVHLVVNAVHAGALLVSGDGKARNGYKTYCKKRPPWAGVMWVTVTESADVDHVRAWFRDAGAVAPLCS